jgi:hypothetical protein
MNDDTPQAQYRQKCIYLHMARLGASRIDKLTTTEIYKILHTVRTFTFFMLERNSPDVELGELGKSE